MARKENKTKNKTGSGGRTATSKVSSTRPSTTSMTSANSKTPASPSKKTLPPGATSTGSPKPIGELPGAVIEIKTKPFATERPPATTPRPTPVAAQPSSPTREIAVVGRTTVPSRGTANESDLGTAIETLNQQMNAAIAALAELAVARRGQAEAVVRTLPLDRATAMFQRLVGEVVAEQLSDMLPTLVGLRSELAQRAVTDGPRDRTDDDFHYRGLDMLDQVLGAAGVTRFETHVGVPFDPLIHLAVGETHRDDLPNGVISEPLSPGFRAARGKVIAPARVKVNRR